MVTVPSSARLILATHNQHKVSELRQILSPLIPGFSDEMVIGAAGLGLPEPLEDGASFTENALLKAQAVFEATGLAAVADDSGISVDIMGGAPGIFSARWAGKHGDDQANLELLLDQLSDIPGPRRQARFVCAAVLIGPNGLKREALGQMPGTILFAPRGENGFGYDPIFQPAGLDKSAAQLSAAEKNAISHRGKAFRNLAPAIAAAIELHGKY